MSLLTKSFPSQRPGLTPSGLRVVEIKDHLDLCMEDIHTNNGVHKAYPQRDDIIFFSLRDTKKDRYATLAVKKATGEILVCLGKDKKRPHPSYLPTIVAYAQEQGWTSSVSPSESGLVMGADGKVHSLYHLPAGFETQSDLSLKNFDDLPALPARVRGSLDLEEVRMKSLNSFMVDGHFQALSCDLPPLSEGTKFGGDVLFFRTAVHRWHKNLTHKEARLAFVECQLPETLSKGDLRAWEIRINQCQGLQRLADGDVKTSLGTVITDCPDLTHVCGGHFKVGCVAAEIHRCPAFTSIANRVTVDEGDISVSGNQSFQGWPKRAKAQAFWNPDGTEYSTLKAAGKHLVDDLERLRLRQRGARDHLLRL